MTFLPRDADLSGCPTEWAGVPQDLTVWERWRDIVADLKEGHVTGKEEAL